MQKKKLIIGISIAAAVLLAIAVWGYQQIADRTLAEQTDLYSAVSDRGLILIETKELSKFADALQHNDFWEQTKEIGIFSEFDQLFRFFSADARLSGRRAIIVFNKSNRIIDSLNVVILVKSTERDANEYLQYLASSFRETNHADYRSVKIFAFRHPSGQTVFCAPMDGIFIASLRLQEIRNTIDRYLSENKAGSPVANAAFMTVKTTAGKNALANIFINTKTLFPVFSDNISNDFLLLKEKLHVFSDWIGLDISLSENKLLVNGYSGKSNDFFASVFDNQESMEIDICSALPANTCFFTYYGISDYTIFEEQLIERKQAKNISAQTEQFIKKHFSGQIVIAYYDNESILKSNSYVMMSIKDSAAIQNELDTEAQLINPIVYQLPFGLTNAFGNFIMLKGIEYAAIAGKYLIISTSPELLYELAKESKKGNTLAKDSIFISARENYDNKSTVLSYAYFPSLLKHAGEIFTHSFAEKLLRWQNELNGIQSLGWQIDDERGMIYHNAFVSYQKKTDKKPSAELQQTDAFISFEKSAEKVVWELPFEAKPEFVTIVPNQVNRWDEILVQDANHKLFSYNYKADSLLWSAPVNAPILNNGKIYQIDYYKNKKYQFIFNTERQIHLVDRKGRNVEKYPLALPQNASAPLAVFDYEHDLDYRIFVPLTDKKIVLYKKEGTNPKDWVFDKTEGVTSLPVQYFDINSKDYLFVNDGIKPYIMHRSGKERAKLKSSIDIAPNSAFYHLRSMENAAVFTSDKQGYLKKITLDDDNEDLNGLVKSIKIDSISAYHYFILTETNRNPLFIFVDKNKLSAYDNQLKIIGIKRFEENDLIPIMFENNYLTLYSPQSKHVYVFNLAKWNEKPQCFTSEQRPVIGQLKPMFGHYIITINNRELDCYKLE